MLSGTFGVRGLKVDRPISIFVKKNKIKSFRRGKIFLSVDGGTLPPSLATHRQINRQKDVQLLLYKLCSDCQTTEL